MGAVESRERRAESTEQAEAAAVRQRLERLSEAQADLQRIVSEVYRDGRRIVIRNRDDAERAEAEVAGHNSEQPDSGLVVRLRREEAERLWGQWSQDHARAGIRVVRWPGGAELLADVAIPWSLVVGPVKGGQS